MSNQRKANMTFKLICPCCNKSFPLTRQEISVDFFTEFEGARNELEAIEITCPHCTSFFRWECRRNNTDGALFFPVKGKAMEVPDDPED